MVADRLISLCLGFYVQTFCQFTFTSCGIKHLTQLRYLTLPEPILSNSYYMLIYNNCFGYHNSAFTFFSHITLLKINKENQKCVKQSWVGLTPIFVH